MRGTRAWAAAGSGAGGALGGLPLALHVLARRPSRATKAQQPPPPPEALTFGPAVLLALGPEAITLPSPRPQPSCPFNSVTPQGARPALTSLVTAPRLVVSPRAVTSRAGRGRGRRRAGAWLTRSAVAPLEPGRGARAVVPLPAQAQWSGGCLRRRRSARRSQAADGRAAPEELRSWAGRARR